MSSLSTTRRIGTQSGDLRREARRLSRAGAKGAADDVYLASAKRRSTEGSAIRTERDVTALETAERGLMESQRRAVTGGDASTTQAATGDLLEQRQALHGELKTYGDTPALRAQATKLGITDSGFQRGLASARTAAPAALTEDSPAPVAAPPALRRGLIDGKPAASVLAGMRSAQGESSEPGNMQEALAAAPKARPVDLPGDAAGPPRTAMEGPLTRAMNEALARRKQREADSVEAGELTAELNAAPAPTLRTEGLGRRALQGPPAPVAAAPTLRRPASPLIKSTATTPNIGAEGFVSLGAPFSAARKKFRDEEAKGFKAPLRSATLALGTGLSRFGRDLRNSYK